MKIPTNAEPGKTHVNTNLLKQFPYSKNFKFMCHDKLKGSLKRIKNNPQMYIFLL